MNRSRRRMIASQPEARPPRRRDKRGRSAAPNYKRGRSAPPEPIQRETTAGALLPAEQELVRQIKAGQLAIVAYRHNAATVYIAEYRGAPASRPPDRMIGSYTVTAVINSCYNESIEERQAPGAIVYCARER